MTDTGATTPTDTDTTAGTGGSGIDLAGLDPETRPQDDLYRHVNGRFLATTTIPADRARWGSFNVLADDAEQAVRDIIRDAVDAAPGGDLRAAGDLFTSFMDTETIEAAGVAPLAGRLRIVSEVEDHASLAAAFGALERLGVGGLLQVFVASDPGDPDRSVVHVEQGGISLPDESYFREERFADVRSAYRKHVARMLEHAQPGGGDAEARADAVFAVEESAAALHWDNVRSRDSTATYNPMTWDEFAASTGEPAFFARWRDAQFGESAPAIADLNVRQPSFVAGLGGLLAAHPVEAWRDWLTWKVVHGAAGSLPDAIAEEHFDFYGRTLTGVPAMRERWKRGVTLVEGALGEAVGREYVERHFPREAKAQMDDLVAHLVEAYRESITALSWMGEETKARAIEKLERFRPKVGHPDRWRDYGALEIRPDDLIGNLARATEFETARELAKLGAPVDRDEWFMTPQTVNAYYNPSFNEIVFPAAILQWPFFDPERDAAANYGGIGAVIGHEIGHGFDDQGSKYDGDGRLADWWTDVDRAAFEERASALIAQYDALAPEQAPDHAVNGALTIGENIGDLGGLTIAWKAYVRSLGGEEPPVVDGLSGAERFFLSWAQVWQQAARDEEVVRLLSIDPHSPNEFRCNQIVRNIDAFYDTFGVTEADALWLPPEQRVTIW